MKFGTREWSDYSFNVIDGCSHDCKYCYAKASAIKRGIKTSDNWKIEVKKWPISKIGHRNGIIMFPTQHDITPSNIDICEDALLKLVEKNNQILIVSKPHLEVIKKFCSDFRDYKKNIKFRFTIGSSSDKILKYWEPNAPSFEERIESLKYSYDLKFDTSVSCEPILDDEVEKIVETTSKYSSEIWIGKPNFLDDRVSINCPNDSSIKLKIAELTGIYSDKWILSLVDRLKLSTKIKWKESIQKVINEQKN